MNASAKVPAFSDVVAELANALRIIEATADLVGKAQTKKPDALAEIADTIRQSAKDGIAAVCNLEMIVQPRAMVIEAAGVHRLMTEYFDAYNANASLQSTILLLPDQPVQEDGKIDVALTIEAFTSVVEKKLSRMYDILQRGNEEERHA